MFSNDNNVETIAQLVEVLKHYIGLQSEYVKLDVIEKRGTPYHCPDGSGGILRFFLSLR